MSSEYDTQIYKTVIDLNANIQIRIKSDISIKADFRDILMLSKENRNKLRNITQHFLTSRDKNILKNKFVKNILTQAFSNNKKKENILIWINNYFYIAEKINDFLIDYNGSELKKNQKLIYHI